MSILQWPSSDRPRERLLSNGSSRLSDSELLAILIQSGTVNQSSVDCARALLQRFGALHQVLDAPQSKLCQQKGIGPAKYVMIQAAAELGRRYLSQTALSRSHISSTQAAIEFFRSKLRHQAQEHFCALFLTASHEVIRYQVLSQGSLKCVNVQKRELAKACLSHDAAGIIIAHNHPSGSAMPSQADLHMTHTLMQALDLIETTLLDHIIIGQNNSYSMQQHGLIRQMHQNISPAA